MSRNLLNNTVVLCREDGSSAKFHIKSHIGSGASCVVYHAVCDDNTEHLLKEYYPRNLNLERNSDGTLIVPEHQKENFDTGLTRFREGNEKQKEVRLSEKLKNFTSNVQGYFYGNGTEYIDMTVFSGRIYNKVENESLHTLLLRMRTLAQVIGYYHEAGLLHLDIKPENIFIRPEGETPEDVILFDFDSVLEKNRIVLAHSLSYTKDWAAPEQILPYKRRSICEATDLFSIGEIIFTKIFGRHSTQAEHRSFAEYEIDYNADIFNNANPKVVPLIKELFKHTICSVVKNRYQTAQELIEKLDEIIKFADPQKPFLQTTYLSEKFFVGRDYEFAKIEEELQNTDRLYISGMGGMGKSELVEQYAKNHKSEYDAIIIATYTTDIKSMICNIPIVNVADQLPNETQDEYVNRKVSALQNIGEENKLFLIIDNYNTEFNSKDDLELFDKVTACAYKTVITTRNNISDERVINIKPIENARAIFDNYYKKPLSDNDSQIVDRIIAIYQNHTLATELLAKQMAAGRINPKNMLEKLNNGGLKNSGFEKIRVGNSKEHNAYSYIHTLFDIYELSEDERYILLNLSLIPPTGISTEIFYKWCELSTYDNINSLVASGWINHDEVYDTISLHPVVADIMLDELEKQVSTADKFFNSYIKQCIVKEETSDLAWEKMRIIYEYANKKLTRFNSLSETAVFFIWDSIRYFSKHGNFKTNLRYLENIVENFSQKISILNLVSLNIEIGRLYCEIDNYSEAKRILSRAEELFKSNNLPVNILARIYVAQASIYDKLGAFSEAAIIIKKALQIHILDYDKNFLTIASDYEILSILYRKLSDFKQAEEIGKKSLNMTIGRFGEHHINCASKYFTLGTLYADLARYKESIVFLKKAQNIWISIYGEKNSLVVQSYGNLAEVFRRIGDYEKAEEYHKKSLNLRVTLWGRNSSRTAQAYNNLSCLYSELQKHEIAETYLKKAIDINKQLYGEQHDKIATNKQNLGVLYRNQGDYNGAIAEISKALDIYISLYGNEHEKVAASYSALGKTYALMGDSIRAEEYYQKSLKIRQELLDPNDERMKLIEKRIEELKK